MAATGYTILRKDSVSMGKVYNEYIVSIIGASGGSAAKNLCSFRRCGF